MILDGHVHIRAGRPKRATFRKAMARAGISGGVLISPPPASFSGGGPDDFAGRLDLVLRWTRGAENMFPFFWIDPLEPNAIEQVLRAVERGIVGFKAICDRYHPGDRSPMAVWREIARARKPILFHSGILWDGKPSGEFCRPVGFEHLLEVDGLRFSLAHISWPWVDECIAVYGKFLNAYSRRPDLSVEMFIDLTPGTPPIYRRDALAKLLTIGYDVERNLIFGTDCSAPDYNDTWAREWIERDGGIYGELGIEADIVEQIFSRNLLRFVGASPQTVKHRVLRAGEPAPSPRSTKRKP